MNVNTQLQKANERDWAKMAQKNATRKISRTEFQLSLYKNEWIH